MNKKKQRTLHYADGTQVKVHPERSLLSRILLALVGKGWLWVFLVIAAGAEQGIVTSQTETRAVTEMGSKTVTPGTGTWNTGGLTDTQLRATPLPVNGTVTAAVGGSTLAITNVNGQNLNIVCVSGCSGSSGATTVTPGTGTWNAGGSSVAVSGSTLAVTNVSGQNLNVAVVGSVGVTGTFYQAVQRVSVDVDTFSATNAGYVRFVSPPSFVSLGSTFSSTTPGYVQFAAPPAYVTLGSTFSSTTPGFIQATGALAVTSTATAIQNSVTVTAGTGTFVTLLLGTTFTAANPGYVQGTIAAVVLGSTFTAANPGIVQEVFPGIAVGVRASTGVTVQEMKDTGRTRVFIGTTAAVSFNGVNFATFSYNSGGALTAAASSYIVTVGKVFRLTTCTFGTQMNGASVANSSTTFTVTERASALGTNVPVMSFTVQQSTFGYTPPIVVPINDGFDFPGGTQIGIKHCSQGLTNREEFFCGGYEW